MAEQDQEFVEQVVKSLVDHPEDVKSERTVDEMGVLITLHINQADMGQVIGRMGQTAKAIRTLLRVVGAKHKARVNLKIYEPEGSQRGPRMGGPRSDHGDHGDHGGHRDEHPTEHQAPANDAADPMDDFKL